MHLVEQCGDAIVIHVKNDLDHASAPHLASTLELAEGDAERRIVVSLAGCRFCDASGLAVLLRAHNRCGPQFFVVLPSATPCRRIFGITGLANVFQVVPTVQHALEVAVRRERHAV